MDTNVKQAQHTPGPWSRNIPPARKYCTVFAGRNTHIAYLAGEHMTDEEAEANINLIAAAPELLAALREALPHVAVKMQGTTDGGPLLARIRAAIAAATGE